MPVYNFTDYIKLMRPLPKHVERDKHGIPVIEPTSINISSINNGLSLINMKNLSLKDKYASNKIVHAFCYDDALKRSYNNMIPYMRKAARCYAVCTFDFSMDVDMDFKHILDATYDNRWSGAFMQSYGLTVIPTVGWVKQDTFDICFAGLRDGGIFMISTLGVNNKISYPTFITGYKELRFLYPNTKLICVGKKLEQMDDDVCYVAYKDSFGSEDRNNPYWQPNLINWDMTIPKGV